MKEGNLKPLLKEVSNLCTSTNRSSFRFGGSEFLLDILRMKGLNNELTLSQPLNSKMYSVAFKLYHPIGRALISFIIVFYENCFFNISIRILCTQNFFA